MTYKEIRKNKEIKAFIKRAGINLTSSGFYRSFRGAYHSCGRQSRRNT